MYDSATGIVAGTFITPRAQRHQAHVVIIAQQVSWLAGLSPRGGAAIIDTWDSEQAGLTARNNADFVNWWEKNLHTYHSWQVHHPEEAREPLACGHVS